METLGKHIFGSPEGFVLVIPSPDTKKDLEIDINYCPFCGTRLEEVPTIQVEKFTRSRKGKSLKETPRVC